MEHSETPWLCATPRALSRRRSAALWLSETGRPHPISDQRVPTHLPDPQAFPAFASSIVKGQLKFYERDTVNGPAYLSTKRWK